MTAEEWAILEPLLPVPAATGRPWQWPLKLIVEAIFYVLRTGCQWRYLPSDFPPWPTVYYWFRRLSADGTWERVNHTLVMAARQRGGRDASPTAAIIDSQSVKATEAAGPRGYDAGKKIMGCKRHILTDTEGHLLSAVVHEACIQDRDGAVLLFSQLFGLFPFISRIFADGGYAGEKLKQALRSFGNWCIEIVKRSDQAKGFRTAAAALGGRTHLCVVRPQPAPLAPVRGFARNSGSLPLRSLSHAARAPSCAIIVTC